MRDVPIACTLSPDDLRTRRGTLLPGLMRLVRRAEPLESGCRYHFDAAGDVLAAITRAIDAERQCCRFFRFQVTVEQDGGPIVLDVTGPPGTREFLADLTMSGDGVAAVSHRAADSNLIQPDPTRSNPIQPDPTRSNPI